MPNDDQKQIVVLIVEDEPLVRMFAGDVLKFDGDFRVVTAINADEASNILYIRRDIKALITNVNIPGSIDGLALAHVSRAQRPDLAIIVTSGVDLTGPLPAEARFLAKPYAPIQLVGMVREMLSLPAKPLEPPPSSHSDEAGIEGTPLG